MLVKQTQNLPLYILFRVKLRTGRFGSVFLRFGQNRKPKWNRTGTVRFGSVLSEIKKKCEKMNTRPSSDRTKTSHSSLESSHRDASNGGKIKSLASIDREIAHGECFLNNSHQKTIYRCQRLDFTTIRLVSLRRIQ